MIDLRKPHLLSYPEDLADLPVVWPEGSTKKPGAKAKTEAPPPPPPRLGRFVASAGGAPSPPSDAGV